MKSEPWEVGVFSWHTNYSLYSNCKKTPLFQPHFVHNFFKKGNYLAFRDIFLLARYSCFPVPVNSIHK